MRRLHRPILATSALLLALAGCARPGGEAGNGTAAATTPSPVGIAADPAYVQRLLAATAFDYGQCRRRPDLRTGADGEAGPGEVLVLIDSSGSMAARAGAGTRMDEARGAATGFLSSLPPGTRGGLATFGDVGDNGTAAKAKSCQAPLHILYPAGAVDGSRLAAAAAALRPAGWTPLAAAIRAAAGTTPDRARRTLYIVSDGIESCGGDPVAAAHEANASAHVIVNVIGFDVRSSAEVAALRQVAAAGGGTYQGASAGELRSAMLRSLASAHSGNSTAMFRAMYAGHDCTFDAIKRQSTALLRQLKADQQAGRINAATALAASRASSDRTLAAMQRDVRGHQQNMRDTDAVNQGIENRMDALDPER